VRIVTPHHDSLAPALKTLFPIASSDQGASRPLAPGRSAWKTEEEICVRAARGRALDVPRT